MKFNLILAGVGGQGILSVANLICEAAIKKGYYFKQSEVHGMSQRGGEVYSHLRISSEPIMSDLIPLGKADMILSLEPLEVGRYLKYLSADGFVISSTNPFINISNYPDKVVVLEQLFKLKNIVAISAENLALKGKNPKGQNLAMLGAAIPFIPFEQEEMILGVKNLFEKKGATVVEANLRVMQMGTYLSKLIQILKQQGISYKTATQTVDKLNPLSLSEDTFEKISAIFKNKAEKISTMLVKNEVEIDVTSDVLKQWESL